MDKRRNWVVAGVIALAVALVAVLGVISGPNVVAGSPGIPAAGDLGVDALTQLADLDDLRLEGVLETESGAALSFDIAVTGEGTVAEVTDAAGGVATFVAVEEKVVVKANDAWWLNTVPAFQVALTDTWTTATDDMGFPMEMLTSLSTKSLHDKVSRTAGGGWASTPVSYPDGTAAFALTAEGSPWTVFVSSRGEPRLLGLDGPLAGGTQKLRQGGPAYPSASFNTSKADDPCLDEAKRKLEEAKPQVGKAPEPPPVPEAGHGPSISIDTPITGVCTTPMCPTPVVVTNSGDEPAVGTLFVVASSGGGGSFLVNVPAGGTSQQTASVVNPANTCTQTCTREYQITAFVQLQSAGTDLDQGKRLYDKGLDPNAPVPDKPQVSGPGVNTTIDGLTNPVSPVVGFTQPDDRFIEEITDLVGRAPEAKITPYLRTLAGYSPKIGTTGGGPHPAVDLGRITLTGKGPEKQAARQALALLAELVTQSGRPNASLTVDQGLVKDTFAKKTYSIAAVTGESSSGDPNPRVYQAVEQAVERVKKADPGYAKVIVLDFGDRVPGYGASPREDLARMLTRINSNGRPLGELLIDSAGKPTVDQLLVANKLTRDNGARYTFTADELTMMTRTRSASPPAEPPNPDKLEVPDVNQRHITTGDPYDPGDPLRNQDESGGHAAGAGVPGKSEFPADWTWEDILEAARQVVAEEQQAYEEAKKNGTSYENAPTERTNPMYGTEWGWRISGTATVKGTTVEITVVVYDGADDDAVLRTAFPNENNTPGAAGDPRSVFVNPELDESQLDPAYQRSNRSGPVTYHRNTDTFSFTVDGADGKPVTITTDASGVPLPGTGSLVVICP